MKIKFAAAGIALMLVLTRICAATAEDERQKRCRDFLAGIGWNASRCVETENIYIPAEFDEVYKNYNVIQRDAGFDLTPYKGMDGIRYTFVIENYPIDAGEPVYADVLTVNGKIIGGDIKTVSMGGFMHSLKKENIS